MAPEDAPTDVTAWEDDAGREDDNDALLLAEALDEPVTAVELLPAREEPPPEDEDDDVSPGGDLPVHPTNAVNAHKTSRGIFM